ncbi:MAG: hypothetical protein BWY28_02739 [bacterium ADurb.Bin236]|nr:MAG: hypothetical protein BWY28_02739 [bacterium ADurb.Bin236]
MLLLLMSLITHEKSVFSTFTWLPFASLYEPRTLMLFCEVYVPSDGSVITGSVGLVESITN